MGYVGHCPAVPHAIGCKGFLPQAGLGTGNYLDGIMPSLSSNTRGWVVPGQNIPVMHISCLEQKDKELVKVHDKSIGWGNGI